MNKELKKKYDLVYLTNSPSFYKLNLAQEISKKQSILFVFLGWTSECVNGILASDRGFDYVVLNQGTLEGRNK